jgi:hypothetical protein
MNFSLDNFSAGLYTSGYEGRKQASFYESPEKLVVVAHRSGGVPTGIVLTE